MSTHCGGLALLFRAAVGIAAHRESAFKDTRISEAYFRGTVRMH